MARRRNLLDGTARAQRGVTLIELLIVMTILALASAIVVVNNPPARSEVRTDAERFAAKRAAAYDLGFLSGQSFRLEVEENQYHFSVFVNGEWERSGLPASLAPSVLSRGTKLEVETVDISLANLEGITGARIEESEIIIVPMDALGLAADFTIKFSKRGQSWAVVLSDNGSIEVSRVKS